MAKFVDLYNMKKEQLGDASPLRFYLVILDMLRITQPRVSPTQLIKTGIACDPEAGLFWEEQFYQQQLAQYGADQKLSTMIFDIELLRTLYQLSWNVFNKGISDVRATKWVDDE